MLGVGEAMMLAAAGFDDEDIPDYVKEKNFIIPVGDGGYVMAPLPPGLNMIPNFGRAVTEYVLGQAGIIHSNASAAGKALNVVTSTLRAFDPLGEGPIEQTFTPTFLKPLMAVKENQDAFGRPISKADYPGKETPGYTRTRENASEFSKMMSEFLNQVSGGTQYTKGTISPTGDDLDYMIGQVTGGVGRETMKALELAKSAYTGEEQPLYRVPIAGKIYGNVNSEADISHRFYQNATRMSNFKAEIEGRQKNPGTGDPNEVILENPEARLYKAADVAHQQIVKLNKTIKEAQDADAPLERIQMLQENKIRIMRQFNDNVRQLQE